jgi:hypothetical protein
MIKNNYKLTSNIENINKEIEQISKTIQWIIQKEGIDKHLKSNLSIMELETIMNIGKNFNLKDD